jgi:hypothetical protein
MRAPLRNLRQPWAFIYFAVGFGLVNYLLTGRGDLVWSLISGLVFAVLMSILVAIRRSRMAKDNDWGQERS